MTEEKKENDLSLNARNNKEQHKCTECGAVLSTKGNLKRHMEEVHTNEKPHKCTECGGKYKSKDSLREHKKRKHNGTS